MSTIGYHVSHEQFSPEDALADLQAAESAGFAAATCSDHFLPWSSAQGHSGFAWAWLGAALQATAMPLSVVTVPGYRYHPAILAQAVATLTRMFPGRFWIHAGSGERLNEHITGDAWPPKPERNARLRESVQQMRRLWRGERVSHRGHIVIDEAQLYTLPPTPPIVFGAALSPATAREVAAWADGLITASLPRDRLRAIVDAFREGGGEGKPLHVQLKVSYHVDDDRARAEAHTQWRTNIFDSPLLAELRMPEEFEAAAAHVRYEDVERAVLCSASTQAHVEGIAELFDLGFDHVYVHNVNRQQRAFIAAYERDVLPPFSRA